MTLGQKLQLLRKEKGFSQEKLAAELDVSRQAVSKWELDITLPETENLIKIGNIFDVSYDYLLKNEQEEKYAAKSASGNVYIDRFIMFMKKQGYILGYVFSAVSLYCLFGYTVSFFRIRQILKVPEGFTSVVQNDYTATYTIMIFYIVLALAGTVAGIFMAKYAEKKTEIYRSKQDENAQEN